MNTKEKKTYTTKEAAAELGCSVAHIEDLCRRNLFDVYDLSKNRPIDPEKKDKKRRPTYRIDRATFLAYKSTLKVNFAA